MSGIIAETTKHLAENGTFCDNKPLTQDHWAILNELEYKDKPHATGQCWYNAQSLALYDVWSGHSRIQYWEGLATPGFDFPTEHAWCTLDGLVIDLTWYADPNCRSMTWYKNRIFGELPPGYMYFGVQIDRDLITKQWEESRIACSILYSTIRRSNG